MNAAPSGLIALLSDFGTRDAYVGAMKGAILSVHPTARLVDLTHEIPPQDVLAGALALAQAVPYFPERTVHLAVVDPGVGTARDPIVVETGRSLLVGPDNGLFTLVVRREGLRRAVRIENPRLARPTVSATFHGRDLFGPAAAHLARGVPLAEFGPEIAMPRCLDIPEPVRTADGALGVVLHVDRFGNAVTNLPAELLAELLAAGPVMVECHGLRLAGVRRTYGEAAPGEALALVGSADLLEIAVREGSAADSLGIARGDEVRVILIGWGGRGTSRQPQS